jgi:hypothetical protein
MPLPCMFAPSRPLAAALQAAPALAGAGPSRGELPSAVDGSSSTLSPQGGEQLPGGGPATVALPAEPGAVPPPPTPRPIGPLIAPWLATQARRFGANLWAGLLGAMFRPAAARHVQPGVASLVTLFVAGLLTVLADGLWRHGLDGRFYLGSLPALTFPFTLALLAVWLALVPGGRTSRFLPAVVGVAAVGWVIDAAGALGFAALEHLTGDEPAWRQAAAWLWWAGWVWLWAATLFMVVTVGGVALRHRAWAAAVLPLVWLAPGSWLAQDTPLWGEDWARHAAPPYPSPAGEAAWARQPALLRAALDGLQRGRPGTTELFHVVVAAYGGQDVFVREARAAHRLLNERFQAQGRGVLLANHPSVALELPFANLTHLRRTLAAVASRMDRDEDVLFLYLTTHGSHDHRLAVELWPYQFDAITPAALRAALDDAGIRYRVLVLSACYAGGFVPALQGEDTAVFTAAAADRSSFGCEDGRDWTYFGEAFYTQGLAHTTDLEQAFQRARAGVTAREAAEGQVPSHPQASVGRGIRAKLHELAARP